MIRVAAFAAGLEIGGTEKQMVGLLEQLDRERFELSVPCLRRHGELEERLAARGVPVHEFPINRLFGPATWRQQFRFAAWTRAQAVDVVHAFGLYANVFALPAAWAARRPALIGSVREQASFWTPGLRRVNLLAIRLADRVVVNARTVYDDLVARGVPADKLRVIPNGVDVERFARPRGDAGLRAELRWPRGAPVVSVVSRLTAGKGIEDFLEAAAIVARVRPKVRFLVVGDGTDLRGGVLLPGAFRGTMRQLAITLGVGDRVAFIGQRADVNRLLAQVDVAVLPSRTEALSNALLEAMAAGAPVAATRVGDHPLVVEDGVSGLLSAPGDPGALARSILHLLGAPELAARLGAAAQRTVRERFSNQRMVQATESLYEEVAPAKSRRALPPPPPAPALAPGYTVEVVRDTDRLAALAGPWQRLVERHGPGHPFVSHEWMTAWWDAFGAGRQLHVVVVWQGAECVGIAPLMLGQSRMYGVPVRRLELCANLHTPRGDVIASAVDRPGVLAAMVSGLCESHWDVLVLRQLDEGSPLVAALAGVVGGRRISTDTWAAQASPLLRLTGDYPTYFGTLTRKFRSNLRNRVTRLERLGAVEKEIIREGAGLAGALDEGFRLEAAAWKGANGTAIDSDPAVRRFYQRFAEAAAARGWLELRFLTVAGRRVAFNFCLRYHGTVYLLKSGYDPALSDCSPGNVLCARIIEDAFRDGLGAVDFLGDDEEWKMAWTGERREHVWLYGFPARPRARLVEAIKFGVVPAIRERRLGRWFAGRQHRAALAAAPGDGGAA